MPTCGPQVVLLHATGGAKADEAVADQLTQLLGECWSAAACYLRETGTPISALLLLARRNCP